MHFNFFFSLVGPHQKLQVECSCLTVHSMELICFLNLTFNINFKDCWNIQNLIDELELKSQIAKQNSSNKCQLN